MKIKEGDRIPIGYGFAGIDYSSLRYEYEVLPIPINYLKRFWIWTLHKTKPFDWEIKSMEGKRKQLKELYRILENMDSIYIRAKTNYSGGGISPDGWGTYSLLELLKIGEKQQVIDWIKETFQEGYEKCLKDSSKPLK